jgi:hypothetical protein
MTKIQEFHRNAMEFAEQAFVAKSNGEFEQANIFFHQAYENERAAAKLSVKENAPEPTLSILHRSAATLAIECSKYREAEKLIAFALSGNPPNEITEELRDLLEKVNFYRHLELRGITLEPNEFQYSISGDVISLGMALADVLIDKFKYIKRLVRGTAGRLIGKIYNELNELNLEIYVSVPRTASFAISFKVGYPSQQPLLPEIIHPAINIIDEMAYCLDLYNRSEIDRLIERINSDDYYNDFISSADHIVPDGEKIKVVGITTIKDGIVNKVALTGPKEKIIVKKEPKTESSIKLAGTLHFEGKIKLIDDQGKDYLIIVPEDMRSEIIKQLLEPNVIVTGLQTKRGIKLQDIKKPDEIKNILNIYDLGNIVPKLPGPSD